MSWTGDIVMMKRQLLTDAVILQDFLNVLSDWGHKIKKNNNKMLRLYQSTPIPSSGVTQKAKLHNTKRKHDVKEIFGIKSLIELQRLKCAHLPCLSHHSAGKCHKWVASINSFAVNQNLLFWILQLVLLGFANLLRNPPFFWSGSWTDGLRFCFGVNSNRLQTANLTDYYFFFFQDHSSRWSDIQDKNWHLQLLVNTTICWKMYRIHANV